MSQNEIKYSIIIPHYNSPETLRKLLASIPETEDIQIIVVDDNSTVDMAGISEQIGRRKNCKLLYNATGVQSAGACRNIGLRCAKGKWVLFADADDYFADNFVELTDKFYDTDCDVIYFAPVSIDLVTQKTSNRHLIFEKVIKDYQKNKSRRNELMLRYRYCSPCSKMIRREYLERYPINFEEVIVANDAMFSTRLAYYMDSFETELEPIYWITKSSGSLTAAANIDRFRVRLQVFVRRCDFLREHLTRREWKILNFSGEKHLIRAFRQEGGIRTMMEVAKLFRENKIKLFSWKNFFNLNEAKRIALKYGIIKA